jgi:isopenicillin-N N-acyltransferase-like protein
MVTDLLILECSGSYYDIGYRYGEARADAIARFLKQIIYDLYVKENLSKEAIQLHARKHIPYIEEYSPELHEMIKGISDATERPLEEIVLINMDEEMGMLNKKACTAFAATGRATRTGEAFHGQTWEAIIDFYWAGKMTALLKLRPKGDVASLNHTEPGKLGCAGLNEKGIGLSWNSVPRIELTVGVPTYIICAEILRQKTIGDALDACIRAKRAGCFNFIITDESEIYDVEASPSDIDISYSSEFIGHANHFVASKFIEKQGSRHLGGSSLTRHHRINRLLEEKCGSIDLEDCKAFLQDHSNYPHSICSHPNSEYDENDDNMPWPIDRTEMRNHSYVLDGWVIAPKRHEFWIAHGSPCNREYKKYTL